MKDWKLVPIELTEAQEVCGIFTASQLLGAEGEKELSEKRKAIYRAQVLAVEPPEDYMTVRKDAYVTRFAYETLQTQLQELKRKL